MSLTTLVVTVSFGAVLLVIIPAFSPFIRASISSMLQRSIAKTITWTGLYRLWLNTGWTSKKQRDGAQRKVQKMKDDVRKKIQKQTLIQSEFRDRVRWAEVKPSSSARPQGPGADSIVNNRPARGSASQTDIEKAIVESSQQCRGLSTDPIGGAT